MAGFVKIGSNAGDAITGERIFPGETVFDTGVRNRPSSFMPRSRTRMVKEETIVWLAEQAGYTLVKRDAGDSGDAEVVDGADASVGDGEVEAGKVKTRRKSTAKRRADGPVEDK